MDKVKLAVIYYSSTGTNYRMAQAAAEAVPVSEVDVRVRKVRELAPVEAIATNPAWQAHLDATKQIPVATPDDIGWADAIIFSSPTRFGNLAAQMKQFLDTLGGLWAEGKTANKVVSAMTSAQNPHGGQEATLLALYTTMYHWGTIVVTPGYTDPVVIAAGGNPYGTSVSAKATGEISDEAVQAIHHQARRVITVAKWIRKGRS